jgi:amicyanin
MNPMRKAILTITVSMALAAAFALSRNSQASPAASGKKTAAGQYQVKIDNFSFGPPTLTVPAGAAVTWTNQDDVPHNIVSTDGKGIKSPVLDTNEKFTYTFSKAGTYAYYCAIHPRMVGKIVVQ